MNDKQRFTAFAGDRLIISGNLKNMILRTKEWLERGENDQILIFEDRTGKQVDFDFRGTPDEVLARLSSHPLFTSSEGQDKTRPGPGRPKLGVICREVSLLPRHWEWLEEQPNGASAALRRLVDEARKHEPEKERARIAREATGRFMSVMAGNFPGFEEALRALYAQDQKRLKELIRQWPNDIRKHIDRLVKEAVRLENEAMDKGQAS